MAAALLLVVLCCLTLQLHVTAAAECRYQVPSTRGEGLCETYDLSKLAALGPFTVNGSSHQDADGRGEAKQAVYYLSLCGDVPIDFLPKECAGVGRSPAYQYTEGEACVALGELSDAVALPVDPMDSTSGVRVVYRISATKLSAEYPYAVVYDLHCNPSATANQPVSAYEWPHDTVKVRWPSEFACSLGSGSGVCPRFTFDGTWNTIRLRPRPGWYDEAKFGIFLHWGVFSVPSFADHHGAEWYWKVLHDRYPDTLEFHNRVYGCSGIDPEKYPCNGPIFSYYDFPPMFRAEMFSPTHWANLFSKAGAKYVVLTSKHHEGWCNFPSKQHWNWNSADLGPHRDLVGDLTNSVVKAGMVMGLYHSLREWYNPLYVKDGADNCSTSDFPDKILNPTMMDMINAYKPMLLWNDGAGDTPCQHTSQYWDAAKFRSWVYNQSPVRDSIVINERCGEGCVGDYTNGPDRDTPGHLISNKWESAFTVQFHSWGYDRRDIIDPYLSTERLIYQLVSTVACNGNLLLNVGPTADGRIDPIFEERLLDIGAWLEVNGEAIYSSFPWRVQVDSSDKKTWYTTSKDGKSVFAITFGSVTPGGTVSLMQPVVTAVTTVSLLGHSGPLAWTPREGKGMDIQVPIDLDRRILGDKCAWTFQLQHVK